MIPMVGDGDRVLIAALRLCLPLPIILAEQDSHAGVRIIIGRMINSLLMISLFDKHHLP